MKIAVCVPPGAADCYGHHTRYAEKLCELGAERDVDVEALHYTAPDFFARLFANLADENCLVHFHSYLYDLRLQTTAVTQEVRHALDRTRARTIATISDHPFASFMRGMIANAHPSTKFCVIDESFSDEIRFINPALGSAQFVHTPFLAPVSFDESYAVDFDSRAYDLVLPLFIVDTGNDGLKTLLRNIDAWFVRVVTATYEIARSDLSRNPFHIFDDCMRAECGMSLADMARRQPEAVPAILNTLARVDGVVRQERRAAVIGSLLHSVGKLKVAVLGSPVPSVRVDDNVEFLGMQQARETAAIMGNSRAVLNCSPSYPCNVHERVIVGMLYGSCVITDVNPAIAQTFGDGDFIAYAPGSSLTIEDIFASYNVKEVAGQGALQGSENAPFSWTAHFESLMQLAQA